LPGGLPRGFFATPDSYTAGLSFLFWSNPLTIGVEKFTLFMGGEGLEGGKDVVFCTGKTIVVDATKKREKNNKSQR